jgi:hypothetical protein
VGRVERRGGSLDFKKAAVNPTEKQSLVLIHTHKVVAVKLPRLGREHLKHYLQPPSLKP